MFPYLIRYGGLSVPAYPVIYGLGIALGGMVLLYLASREGLNVRKVAHIILIVALSSLLGGRLFYVLQHIGEFRGNWDRAFILSDAGQVFYGGLLLAIPVIFIYCRLTRLPVNRIFDLAAVSAPAGLALGRWACFCRGCCYGRITDCSLAVEFPKHIDVHGDVAGSLSFLRHVEQGLINETAQYSLPVHPAQIYSSLLSLGVFLIMLWFWKTGRVKGKLLLVYLVLYTLSRFFVEFFRDNQMAFGGLTIAQVLSIIIFSCAVFVLLIFHFRKEATKD